MPPVSPALEAVITEAKRGISVSALTKAALSHPDLFSYTSGDGTTVLHWAALRGDLGVLDACLTFGADVRARALHLRALSYLPLP